MKNFDEERTNGSRPKVETFQLGGETFTPREFVHADVLGEFGNRQVAHFGDTIDAYDEFIKGCLVEEDGPKWDKVRKDKTIDPPITVGAIEQVCWWLMSQAAGRPTEASSSSRRGRAAQTAT